ncbi:pyridoxamine 5'-phosphate oxidase-related FMN-binding protein [Ancylobacter novellus DSM 506]|uniref:Pyridoxamine 5'-phosphate oxidase-related FMN-binding protein n=1 Tax=Ancylobacter novellus (strain ATCC 8093 / DSM 506 / JCM 20403 / CCM 1077 / IAM 12100 / NBRC 12443 / NCIMB 10456) TaxID=639283 RepID=D7A4E2_ANCN5|nr:pyridoxamine 5'-phosphate oxidase family protein [Ancylobacter novellus]ADH89805.1 pyridoxamine 5'-phosphate oxidase-related FMN-binding protein [Ancylobacter novellus DSM 506]
MARLTSPEQLRALYASPRERSRRKVLPVLDPHCRTFIGLSPLVMLASFGADRRADVTPRGDAPGFVQVEDAGTLLLPDRPGNNRLDTLTNLLANPAIGLLFLIPGVDETLRVNGRAFIHDDADLLARFEVDGRLPVTVLRVEVEEAYLHCAKAFMRSHAWDASHFIERARLPSMGEMLRDQLNLATAETQAEMLERYKATLY